MTKTTATWHVRYLGLATTRVAPTRAVGHVRNRWRWLFPVPAIVVPALVALSRLYRREDHPPGCPACARLAYPFP